LNSTVNGSSASLDGPPGQLLIDYLRDDLALRGTKRSCDVQICGACTVLLDGEPVSSCCLFAIDAAARSVQTIEGLARPDHPHHAVFTVLEDAFVEHAAMQCGFCTPGFLVTLVYLVIEDRVDVDTTDVQLRHLLRGNLCRCTGYAPILAAVRAAIVRLSAAHAVAAG
jgi:carbon-monoxide dehydrogenase small subunit